MTADFKDRHCERCGRTPIPYNRRSLCEACYTRQRRSDPEIAERSRECSRQWKREHRDENRARDREYKRQQRVSCPRCSELMRAGSKTCQRCRSEDKQRRLARMAELWARGLSLKEIAADLGSTPGSTGVTITRARAEGSTAFPFRRKVAA